ncbi:AzlC family ABC transporter permease [Pokkaliibacter sp. MBI-7]|uniref:AzlC family ABC transporter permease n=1 Tax=Pokkaliibacter sp. MBI-7 TaxID=3040600 RepID=UPI00244AA1F2|nr:AzlC family ABC transporter permease [Pokkaliibacter sp. MBI-7]MDH2431987.1 AzlC family ABC transporter permease [Pokkaliibacter sp. MBI-7]
MQRTAAKAAFFDGVRTLLPLTPGVLPFGLVTGLAAVDMGYSPGTTLGMTLLFFAGSAQMAAFQLLKNDAYALVILLTTIVINLRFVMYSASLAPHLHHLPRSLRWSLSYLLSDQAYALSIVRLSSAEQDGSGHWFLAGTALSMWLCWVLSVMVGVFVGAGIPQTWSLEFAIPLSFLALLVPAIRNSASLSAATVAGIIAILAAGMPYNLGLLLASCCGIITGLTVESLQRRAA